MDTPTLTFEPKTDAPEAYIAMTSSGDIAFHPAGHADPILVLGKDGTIVINKANAVAVDIEVVDAMREFLGLSKVQRDGQEKEKGKTAS